MSRIYSTFFVQAKLGDILELRWEIMAMDDELDFFVKNCFAEPGVGAKAEERLQLIQGGSVAILNAKAKRKQQNNVV